MTLDETHARDETHSNKWGVWRLAGFSSPIGDKIACSADIAISGFVVCSSELSTNQDLVAPDPPPFSCQSCPRSYRRQGVRERGEAAVDARDAQPAHATEWARSAEEW